jgi:lauroyl/myristoyl acyltransferase
MRGVFWRQFCGWAVNQIPHHLEPLLLFGWTLFFFVLWRPGRIAVLTNISVIAPSRFLAIRYARAFRVFYNFAATFTDTMHFNEHRMNVDWVLEGDEHFQKLQQASGAIILTAHLGNYDLGSYLFAQTMKRQLVIVRAAEEDPESDAFSKDHRQRIGESLGKLDFNDPTGDNIAIPLLQALQRGELVAIQGDRLLPGAGPVSASLFDREVQLPAGPFALAMAARAPIFPMFIARVARRSYRVIAGEPILCERTGRDRKRDIERAARSWAPILERIINRYWYQWFTFFGYFGARR